MSVALMSGWKTAAETPAQAAQDEVRGRGAAIGTGISHFLTGYAAGPVLYGHGSSPISMHEIRTNPLKDTFKKHWGTKALKPAFALTGAAMVGGYLKERIQAAYEHAHEKKSEHKMLDTAKGGAVSGGMIGAGIGLLQPSPTVLVGRTAIGAALGAGLGKARSLVAQKAEEKTAGIKRVGRIVDIAEKLHDAGKWRTAETIEKGSLARASAKFNRRVAKFPGGAKEYAKQHSFHANLKKLDDGGKTAEMGMGSSAPGGAEGGGETMRVSGNVTAPDWVKKERRRSKTASAGIYVYQRDPREVDEEPHPGKPKGPAAAFGHRMSPKHSLHRKKKESAEGWMKSNAEFIELGTRPGLAETLQTIVGLEKDAVIPRADAHRLVKERDRIKLLCKEHARAGKKGEMKHNPNTERDLLELLDSVEMILENPKVQALQVVEE
jgi:hypothetical protein